MEEALKVNEAAKYMRCSGHTVRKLIRGKQLNAYRVGRNIRIRLTDLARFCENGGSLQSETVR